MFEIGSGELRATFLGNHSSEATERHDNTARHYVNEQRAATRQHGGHNSTRGATPLTRRHTPYEALHTGHYTRYGAVHPIRRGVMPPDRVQRPQSQEQTRNLRDDRRHAQGPGSSRSRGLQHSAITSQHSTIGDPSSPITNHQSPISSQQPLHNYQSTISRRSRWRRRGRPRR